MPDCDLTNKSDGDILTDLQAISSKVTGFIWVVSTPRITFSSAPDDKEKAAIRRYFSEKAHQEWVEI